MNVAARSGIWAALGNRRSGDHLREVPKPTAGAKFELNSQRWPGNSHTIVTRQFDLLLRLRKDRSFSYRKAAGTEKVPQMKISVDLADLPAIACIERTFGIPTPQDAGTDEVFGPYLGSSGEGFLVYNGKRGDLSYRGMCDCTTPLLASADIYQDADREQIVEMIHELRSTAPTYVPAQKGITVGRPFFYERWQFAWLFVPELQRWELAPLGTA